MRRRTTRFGEGLPSKGGKGDCKPHRRRVQSHYHDHKAGRCGEGIGCRIQGVAQGLGAAEPQIKALPTLYLGRAEESIRPYKDDERVTENCFKEFSKANLQCSYCRMVTANGVYVCPILIDDPKARLGTTLGESLIAYGMESPRLLHLPYRRPLLLQYPFCG